MSYSAASWLITSSVPAWLPSTAPRMRGSSTVGRTSDTGSTWRTTRSRGSVSCSTSTPRQGCDVPPFAGGVSLNTIERCGLEIKYLRVRSGPQRGRYVHQLVMEAALGRSLMSFEEVDHIDGDTLNNCWLNLQI